MSYDSDPQTMEAANSALEVADADANENPESNLGDGATFGKYCFLEGKYKRGCQSCTGIVCNLGKW